MSELRTDSWLAEGNLKQPKVEIADYVEQQGILVPRRFADVDEARSFVSDGGTVLARSEHPAQYDGPSGLWDSFRISIDRIEKAQSSIGDQGVDQDIDELISNAKGYDLLEKWRIMDAILNGFMDNPSQALGQLKRLDQSSSISKYFAKYTDISQEQLLEDSSYSFWEHIPRGTSVVVVADDVVASQYHILAHAPDRGSDSLITNGGGEPLRQTGYSVQNGKYIDGEYLTPKQRQIIIDTYERVRNLPKFDSEHCPIMEFTIDKDGKLWFLQYHRSRDFNEATDLLDEGDFATSQGWQKADVVRGAIGLSTLQMSLYHPEAYTRDNPRLPEIDEAAAASSESFITAEEILVRRRLADISAYGFERLYGGKLLDHGYRSRWFKPQASISLPEESRITSDEIFGKVLDEVIQHRRMARVVIDIASDGRNGYYRVNPDAEQPVLTEL